MLNDGKRPARITGIIVRRLREFPTFVNLRVRGRLSEDMHQLSFRKTPVVLISGRRTEGEDLSNKESKRESETDYFPASSIARSTHPEVTELIRQIMMFIFIFAQFPYSSHSTLYIAYIHLYKIP